MVQEASGWGALGGGAVYLRGFGFGSDSSFQNTAEYIGCILGVVGLVLLGVRDADIKILGDSIAALTWAETERARGQLVTNASMVFTLLSIRFNLDVKKGIHISGENNWRCDRLSRLEDFAVDRVHKALIAMGMSQTIVVNLQESAQVQTLLACCDPKRCLGEEEIFLGYWGELRSALNEVERAVTNSSNTLAFPSTS